VRKRRRPPTIVEVIWEDIVTTSGWEAHRKRGPDVAECRTVGYVVMRDKKHIVLVSSWSSDERMSKTTIPMGVVVSITELRK
jgi:hypothetical protein